MEAAPNIAIFCDYENVAIGARDAKFDDFNVQLVLERLLEKGNVVVKKAYADWERYKTARRALHEAAFELIEIPHVSYSGKNSADIRLVVDALDLCYTKEHLDVFVIVSGDSDFSPLVSKLRENDKKVIGVGVKSSSSDLLIDNCDEFILYDDLVRAKTQTKRGDQRRTKTKVDKEPAKEKPATKGTKVAEPKGKVEAESEEATLKEDALELVVDTAESLLRDRDDSLWGSMVKQTLKRKRPSFSETYYGYRSFNLLLEDAQRRGLLVVEKDAKSGGYIILSLGPSA
ncbi:MAG: NYN domain-containing protein [Myxococcota bacterium]